MDAGSVLSVSDGFAGMAQPELLKGAVAGAFIVAIAFLAGYAAIRRSGLAVCALLMVTGAAALEFSWLGFFSNVSSEGTVMLQALFAAATIVFLSATVGAARFNPILGAVMFTAALVFGGMGILNFFDRIDLAPLMRFGLIGVGGFAVVLALLQSVRGDSGARLVLPGVALAAGAALLGVVGAQSAVMTVAAHGLFTLGVLAASIVAITEGGALQQVSPMQGRLNGEAFGFRTSMSGHERQRDLRHARERDEIVLDSQIARVLDYSGVGVWDWSVDAIDQTESLATLLGADSDAPFTPEALRNFIHADDARAFDSEILSPIDGPFDVRLKLFDGRQMRLRGARAANEASGEIERLVAFVEEVSDGVPSTSSLPVNGVNEKSVRSATEAAIVPAPIDPMNTKFSAALENGDIIAAFQPVVSLDNKKVAGYEALARWRDQEDGADEGPEQFVRAAERAGQGGKLAATMLDQAASFLSDTLKTEKRKDLFVAMNVSWGQISEDGFVDAVRDAVSKYDLPKKALVLELTEADAVTDAKLAGDVFKKLKSSGVALAFDDFGAGFTCLSNLRKYDFDYLKIDKSFAVDLESGGDGLKIVGSLAGLGKDLGLKVIVEGLESQGAAKKAQQAGCTYGQGFTFGKPVVLALTPKAETETPVETAPVEKALAADEDETRPVRKRLFGAPSKKSKAKDEADTVKLAPVVDPRSDKDADSAAEKESASTLAGDNDEDEELRDTSAVASVEDATIDNASSLADEPLPNDNPVEKKIEVDFGADEYASDKKSRRWRLWGGAQDLR